ncbi:unnamed protein product [Ranitomeya imitator]|uniref:Uncharacterized protein n=1 Tax=Ranitomeya imitator TaxID=111125 RepID=A0ABN9MIR3_9NEOB|nr:unnamed protein product [Ranitomeya imitator]
MVPSISQVTLSIFELATSAGIPCDVDPSLVAALSTDENRRHICVTSWFLTLKGVFPLPRSYPNMQ